jgi:hypothetical protein
MNEPDEPTTPAEARVADLLATLRDEPLGSRLEPASVVRSARWQRVARQPLKLMGALAGAVADGLGMLARSTQGGGRR